ncbi:hypothetical protein FKP32DRAFT_64211 [Trametes sanguinea]|nr:hypothetical protein FKP32DRAFT_64211 [Trametes sanguinea]
MTSPMPPCQRMIRGTDGNTQEIRLELVLLSRELTIARHGSTVGSALRPYQCRPGDSLLRKNLQHDCRRGIHGRHPPANAIAAIVMLVGGFMPLLHFPAVDRVSESPPITVFSAWSCAQYNEQSQLDTGLYLKDLGRERI